MTGYPCRCVGTGTGTGTAPEAVCDCFKVVIDGVVNSDATPCPCRECPLIDDTWYTKRQFITWIPPTDYNRWHGTICNNDSPVEKCKWEHLQNQVTLEDDGHWYLNAWLSRADYIQRPDESGDDYVHWRKDMGTSEPDCLTFDGEILTWYRDSQTQYPGDICRFTTSTATVSYHDLGTGTAICPIGINCNTRPEVCASKCAQGRVPSRYEITILDDWTANQCDCPDTEDNCSLFSGTFLTPENKCSAVWSFSVGGEFAGRLVFVICRFSPGGTIFGALISLYIVCNAGREGRDPNFYCVGGNVTWATGDLGPCDPNVDELGDCFFGGAPLSVPFHSQGQEPEFCFVGGGVTCGGLGPGIIDWEPWRNPCCIYGGSAATVVAVG